MYTLTRGPSKLATQRRTGTGAPGTGRAGSLAGDPNSDLLLPVGRGFHPSPGAPWGCAGGWGCSSKCECLV
uniref:Uncharacterized protein n=1 Tax=Strix occidentalis caurina TaxID=311401 RepID=A0A8D0EVI9_STROC